MKKKSVRWKMLLAASMLFMNTQHLSAQDGAAGIEEADSLVRQYFDVGINLMYAIGAVVGLIGAVRVYNKWSGGQPDTGQTAAAWFGSCIFLVIVATVLRSFFGV